MKIKKKNKKPKTLKRVVWFKDVLRNSLVIFYILVLSSCIAFQSPVRCLQNPTGNLRNQKSWTAHCSRQQQLQFYQQFSYFHPFSNSGLPLLFFWGLLIEFRLSDLAVQMGLTTLLLLFHYRVNPIGFFVAIMTVNGFPMKLLNSSTVY